MACHLTEGERKRISEMLEAGFSKGQIAQAIGRHRSSLYRELGRNSVDGVYAADQAQQLAEQRKRRPRCRKLDDPQLAQYVRIRLIQCWSPEQIAGRFRREFPCDLNRHFSLMTVYRWIDRQLDRKHWRSFLRFGKRKSPHDRRGKLKATVQIEDRPKLVDCKTRYGDWEGDTVLGKQRKSALVTLTERKRGFARVGLVRRFRAANVHRQMHRLVDPLPEELKQTLTLDNGTEFARHQQLTKQNGLKIYFARPYHAWDSIQICQGAAMNTSTDCCDSIFPP